MTSNTVAWIVVAIITIAAFVYARVVLPKLAIREYEPDDDLEVTVIGELVVARDYKQRLYRPKIPAVVVFLNHTYWVVRDEQTGLQVAALVNWRKKQFKKAREEFHVGDRVMITGGYIKRVFYSDAAAQVLDASDAISIAVPDKKKNAWLNFSGPTVPPLNPFGLRHSMAEEPPTGIMLVAQDIEKLERHERSTS
jgi:preprotein translocase subunit YajC